MKFKKFGQFSLALAVSLGLGFGLTSCANDYTVAYLYVTGAYQNQIGAFKVANNTGNLSTIPGSPFGSNGTNPIRAVISSTGRYLYVLNEGTPSTPDASGNFTYQGSNISVYSIGGNGTLAFQQSYTSQGFGSLRLAFSSTGSFLYILDEYAPAAPNPAGGYYLGSNAVKPGLSCQDSSGVYHPTGGITAFSADPNTGRLSLITNNQLQDTNGTQLTYFPVGCEPIDFKVTGGFALTADTSDPTNGNHFTVYPYGFGSNGQLVTTQNTEFVTGAQSISAIGSDFAQHYIYILDPVTNNIFIYTVGTSGLLQAINGSPASNAQTAAGDPVNLISDSKSQFLYVINAGPSSGQGNANSDISGFAIASNGFLSQIASNSPFPTGSSPRCILEDPSNQYIFTADYDSNTLTGKVLDPASGQLTPMRNQSSYPTVGNPTWCVASGHTD
jgi:6-phosphogluconolactonase (cycloisomerase 2 family)